MPIGRDDSDTPGDRGQEVKGAGRVAISSWQIELCSSVADLYRIDMRILGKFPLLLISEPIINEVVNKFLILIKNEIFSRFLLNFVSGMQK